MRADTVHTYDGVPLAQLSDERLAEALDYAKYQASSATYFINHGGVAAVLEETNRRRWARLAADTLNTPATFRWYKLETAHMKSPIVPSIGRIVWFSEPGTYCQAAIITGCYSDDVVSLMVFPPSGGSSKPVKAASYEPQPAVGEVIQHTQWCWMPYQLDKAEAARDATSQPDKSPGTDLLTHLGEQMEAEDRRDRALAHALRYLGSQPGPLPPEKVLEAARAFEAYFVGGGSTGTEEVVLKDLSPKLFAARLHDAIGELSSLIAEIALPNELATSWQGQLQSIERGLLTEAREVSADSVANSVAKRTRQPFIGAAVLLHSNSHDDRAAVITGIEGLSVDLAYLIPDPQRPVTVVNVSRVNRVPHRPTSHDTDAWRWPDEPFQPERTGIGQGAPRTEPVYGMDASGNGCV